MLHDVTIFKENLQFEDHVRTDEMNQKAKQIDS